MNTSYFKYLFFPLVLCIVSTFFAQIYSYIEFMLRGHDYFGSLTTDKIFFSFILHLLYLFVATLIFSIAYQQTRLTLNNSLYIIVVAVVLIFKYILISMLHAYLEINSNGYLVPETILNFFTFFFSPITSMLVIAVATYFYAKINKLTAMPISNKVAACLYAGLFMSLAIVQNVQTYSGYYATQDLNSSLLFSLITNIISLAILFFYCYTWVNQLLKNKNTASYPSNIIFSFALSILITLFIFIALAFLFALCMPKIETQSQVKSMLFLGTITAYIFGIPLFIKLLCLSASKLYRRIHIAFYSIVFIGVTLMLWKTFLRADGLKVFFALCALYGFTLFAISFSLFVIYGANKRAINLLFKEHNR